MNLANPKQPLTLDEVWQAHKCDIRNVHPGFKVIFLSLNGSRLYGTNREDSDHDLCGAAIETRDHVFGLKVFEQWEFKSYQTEGTIYSLRKFVRLLAQNNPTLLCLLFNQHAIDPYGLQKIRDAFPNRKAADAFHGYAKQQLYRISHVTGMHVTRQDLIDAHGYDTKYAAHILRLYRQGKEYIQTRHITLPMTAEAIDEYKFIYNGGFKTFDEFRKYAEPKIDKLDQLRKNCPLPDNCDDDTINDWLIDTYTKFYAGDTQ